MQSWASTGRLTLKLNKGCAFPRLDSREKRQDASKPNVIVFCEKTTGVAMFRTESYADSEFGVERLAGLVAMQCLARGHSPDDFLILVPAGKTLGDRLVTRAKELLQEGQEIPSQATLSPRQQEVLHSVICNRGNKEIASSLNITVRTVKFHISALLSKFGVQSRLELARRAAGFMRPTILRDAPEMAGFSGHVSEAAQSMTREPGPVGMGAANREESKTRSLRFPGRILTA
jgi:DNA-binding CsgD family transcriptional regulator